MNCYKFPFVIPIMFIKLIFIHQCESQILKLGFEPVYVTSLYLSC